MAKRHGTYNNNKIVTLWAEMDKKTNITPHFRYDERGIACSCCGLVSFDERIFWVLELLRCILNKPIYITSCCRCWDNHVKIYEKLKTKITTQSKHLCEDVKKVFTHPNPDQLDYAKLKKHVRRATAIDFTCGEPSDLAQLAVLLENWSGGFHYYQDKNFIHIDIGPMRRW